MIFFKKLIDKKVFCPYCKKELAKKPSRKTRCPFCSKFIFVRTNPKTKKKVLVTEQGVKDIEKEWEHYLGINGWLNDLSQYGITKSDFDSNKDALAKKFGKEPYPRDVIWGIFNQLILKTNDLRTLSTIYFQMALFLNEENKDSSLQLKLHYKMILLDYKNSGVIDRVEICACDNSCPECKKDWHNRLSINEALKTIPLPNKKCTFRFNDNKKPFCRCTYIPIMKGEK